MPPGEPSKQMTMKRKSRKPNTILENASKSAEIVASIDDILTEILIKVPIKPLFRSKLVSKHWLSLISSRDFCLRRNPNPNPAEGIFLCIKNYHVYQYKYFPLIPNNSESLLPSINLNFTTAPLSTQILQSCNGLLLCCCSLKWIEIDPDLSQRSLALLRLTEMDHREFYVYNPTTNFSVPLPDFPSLSVMTRFEISRISTTLVFDPVNSPHYKVVSVVLVTSMIGRTCEILIYSSETGDWSHDGGIVIERCFDVCGCGVYWNGSVHWLNEKFSTRNPKNSMRFHIDTRMLGDMPSPPVVCDKNFHSNVYFGESCDHLHFIECILPKFNVYEMKRDYSEWFVKYKVDISPIIAEFPEEIMTDYLHENCDVAYVLSLIRQVNDKESKLVLRVPHIAIKINLVDGTWEKLCDFVHNYVHKMFWYDDHGIRQQKMRFGREYGLEYIQYLYSLK